MIPKMQSIVNVGAEMLANYKEYFSTMKLR